MEERSIVLKLQYFFFKLSPVGRKMIQFVTVWGTGSSSPGEQEVWLPCYMCAALHLSFLPPLFFWLFC